MMVTDFILSFFKVQPEQNNSAFPSFAERQTKYFITMCEKLRKLATMVLPLAYLVRRVFVNLVENTCACCVSWTGPLECELPPNFRDYLFTGHIFINPAIVI